MLWGVAGWMSDPNLHLFPLPPFFLSLCPFFLSFFLSISVRLFVLHAQCLLSRLAFIFPSLPYPCVPACPPFPRIAFLYFNLSTPVDISLRTILLSVISLLNEPNTFSPANVDASVMFRKWRDSKGKDKEYAEIIR